MSDNFALDVQAEPAHLHDKNLPIDILRLKEYMVNGFKMGWNNERICTITGLPPSIVSDGRSKWEKERKVMK